MAIPSEEQISLESIRACAQACDFLDNYNSMNEAWQVMPQGDWMLWYLSRIYQDMTTANAKSAVSVACELMRETLSTFPEEHQNSVVVDLIESWVNDSITLENLRNSLNIQSNNTRLFVNKLLRTVVKNSFTNFNDEMKLTWANIIRTHYSNIPEIS